MTSFAGLVIVLHLFKRLDLKGRLRRCFGATDRARTFGLATIILQLVVQVMLGFRRLRDRDYYADDPMVRRVLGVAVLPDVATISRTLAAATSKSFLDLRDLIRELVLERLATLRLATVTLDFDGSVLSTRRHAEGSAVGYNKNRKGARSYYPLFCTVAQVSQFLDLHHRPGNVHDSRDADAFIEARVGDVRRVLPRARIECRLDSAFFSDKVVAVLEALLVEFAVSVPFERFPALRARILRRTSGWTAIDDTHAFIEIDWRPKSWPVNYARRFVAIRTTRPIRRAGPLQLDIFEPVDHEYEYKVFITNKIASAGAAMLFHNGRGNQEAILGEGKHWAALDYVPCRRLVANQLYSGAAVLAHNLARELQMVTDEPRARRASPTRAAMFGFSGLGRIRDLFLRRAGSITRPGGRPTLTISATGAARQGIERFIHALQAA